MREGGAAKAGLSLQPRERHRDTENEAERERSRHRVEQKGAFLLGPLVPVSHEATPLPLTFPCSGRYGGAWGSCSPFQDWESASEATSVGMEKD